MNHEKLAGYSGGYTAGGGAEIAMKATGGPKRGKGIEMQKGIQYVDRRVLPADYGRTQSRREPGEPSEGTRGAPIISAHTPRGHSLWQRVIPQRSDAPMRYPTSRHYDAAFAFTSPGDQANRNAPNHRGNQVPHCPVLRDPTSHAKHEMITVRECHRKYCENGGIDGFTTMFHCWSRGDMKRGDSWHCLEHQIDYCQDCEGTFGRMYLPNMHQCQAHREERTKYVPALEPTELEITLLRSDRARVENKGNAPLMNHDRDNLPEELRRPLRLGSRPEKGEGRRWAPPGTRGREPFTSRGPGPGGRGAKNDPRALRHGSTGPSRGSREKKSLWSDEIYPEMKHNRGHDWFRDRAPHHQCLIKDLVGWNWHRGVDFTAGTWMEAMGFMMTKLLRHGVRWPGYEADEAVPGIPELQ